MGSILPALRAMPCHAVLCRMSVPPPPRPFLTCLSCPDPSPAFQGYCFEVESHHSGWGDDGDVVALM